ncbi:MAG: aminomethyl-transferring glycine dehydrogenase subunit GcvPA [Candidatus Hydrothermales bacterium]
MPFIPDEEKSLKKLKEFLNIKSLDELLWVIPDELKIKDEISLPYALSELEVEKYITNLALQNHVLKVFGGAGSYDHYVPPVVRFVIKNPSFLTAYTPYQAEVSQGTLQAMYEFQTAICELTQMDVANSSMYDGASAFAEAVLMAERINKKKKVLIADNINPFYKEVLKTYASFSLNIESVKFISETGEIDLEDLEKKIDKNTSCFAFQHPNFFGILENPFEIRRITKKKDLILISIFDPVSISIISPPGEYDADIAVCEGQPLGIPLSFGGPYAGIFTAKKEFIRMMPGRIAGKTVDADGKEGYVMVLQTREQHIRREKATSNICTNQMLCALAILVYILYMGEKGLKEVAIKTFNNTNKIKNALIQKGYNLPFKGKIFREFVVELKEDINSFIEKAIKEKRILPGIPLNIFGFKENYLLTGATEKHSESEINEMISLFK